MSSNDRIGNYNNDLQSIFERLLIIEEKMKVIVQRINWLENPETAPKPKKAPPKEPEGKL
jgi:hypothetical protein